MQRPNAAASRKKEYKKGVDAEDARRKREDNIIELRKIKRDENLQKKRQVHAGPSYALSDSTRSSATEVQAQVRGAAAGGRGGAEPGRRGGAGAVGKQRAAPRRPAPAQSGAARQPAAAPLAPRPPAPQMDELPAMVRQVYQGTPEEQFNATQKFRKLLSIGARRATRATRALAAGP